MFTREWLADLRRVRDNQPWLPRIVVVHQGTVEQGEELFAKLLPDVPAVSDVDRDLYRAFGLSRGRLGELFGLRAWVAGLRAFAKGHFIGRPVGDPWMMPGMFLAHRNEILWSHRFEHAGDQPDEATLVAHLKERLAVYA